MEPKPNLFLVAGLHTQITLTLEIAAAITLVVFVAGLLLVPLDDAALRRH